MISKLKQHLAIRRTANAMVRLFADTVTEKDQARIAAWRQASPRYQENFVHTAQMLSDLETLADDPDLLAIAGKTASKPVARLRQAYGPKLAVAASILAVAVAAFQVFYSPQDPTQTFARYVTRIGEQKTINLADGTAITLNTGTELLVELNSKARKITLDRGEAYFDVAGDPQRPFTVNLGQRQVSVLGTRFNLFKTPDDFTLAVIEGLVTLHRPGEPISDKAPLLQPEKDKHLHLRVAEQRRITAGTVARFDNQRQTLDAYQAEDMEKLHRWRTGIIRFDAVPLSEVVQELNRYTSQKIIIRDAAIMDLKLYATVRLDRINEAIGVFEMTLPVKVVRYFDQIVLEKAENGQ